LAVLVTEKNYQNNVKVKLKKHNCVRKYNVNLRTKNVWKHCRSTSVNIITVIIYWKHEKNLPSPKKNISFREKASITIFMDHIFRSNRIHGLKCLRSITTLSCKDGLENLSLSPSQRFNSLRGRVNKRGGGGGLELSIEKGKRV